MRVFLSNYSYVTYLYVDSVQCVVSLLFASLYCCPDTRLIHFNILFMFIFLFYMFVFYLVYSVFWYCFVYSFIFSILLSLAYFCASLPTPATRWKPNCSKKYHIIILKSFTVHFVALSSSVPHENANW
jgi:hypothetical protein